VATEREWKQSRWKNSKSIKARGKRFVLEAALDSIGSNIKRNEREAKSGRKNLSAMKSRNLQKNLTTFLNRGGISRRVQAEKKNLSRRLTLSAPNSSAVGVCEKELQEAKRQRKSRTYFPQNGAKGDRTGRRNK